MVDPLLYEYVVVVFFYLYAVDLIIKYFGGKNLKALEMQLNEYMKKENKKKEDYEKMNRLMAKKFNLTMKAQLYAFPLVFIAISFIKHRYGSLVIKLWGINFGWLKLLLLLSFIIGPIADKLATITIEKVKS